MKHILTLIAALAALFVVPGACSAQSLDDYPRQIDSVLKTTRPRGFNGVVLITQDGSTLYSKAYGYADLQKKTPLKVTDRFSTMSIAKQVTATLLLLEAEKGSIDLHIPIRKYLPTLKYAWADTVTLHQLLNHTSGLESSGIDKPLKFAPGKEFSYSNAGYSLAGLVLEQQSGKTFRELVTGLFKQCGMDQSAYYGDENHLLMSKGHTVRQGAPAIVRTRISFSPADYFASHLMVTAPDLAKWNECLHKGRLLKPGTYESMIAYTITAHHPLFGSHPVGYGYGLRVNDQEGFKEIGHTGFHPGEGFTAVILYYPETGLSIVVMENQAHENFETAYYFEQEIRNIMLNTGLVKKNTR